MTAFGDTTPVVRCDTSSTSPAITFLSWDTEGTGREKRNLLEKDQVVTFEPPVAGVTLKVEQRGQELHLVVQASSDAKATSDSVVLRFPFDPKVTPTTILPSAFNGIESMALPAIVSAPDFGQMLLTCDNPSVVAKLNGSRAQKKSTLELKMKWPEPGQSIKFALKPLKLEPPRPDIDPEMWALARRGWYNAFQPASAWGVEHNYGAPMGMLSNNVISDPVSFALWMYADQALYLPELAPGISAMPIVKRTLDWWMDEKTSTTGECIGYWAYYHFLDSNPSLIISAWDYVESERDLEWLKRRIDKLEHLAKFVEGRDLDGDGLIEATQSGNRGTLQQPHRSSCWWDAVNCGHKDGYSNALIYRAWRCLADLEKQLGRTEKQKHYLELAKKLKANYSRVLMNEKTGWLGWWRSQDGELHDYATPIISSMAIEYGLIEPEEGRKILQRLRDKIKTAGFSNFKLGVPCFLDPVHRSDYLLPDSLGCPKQEDGKDTFGHYMNGGVNASHVTHFLAAHYVVDDPEPADAILREMLKHLNAGGFQNGVTDEAPKGIDWADWEGKPHGYEGYLSDSFRFVQAVITRNKDAREKLYRVLKD